MTQAAGPTFEEIFIAHATARAASHGGTVRHCRTCGQVTEECICGDDGDDEAEGAA